MDIYETTSALVLEAELPGFARDEIDINLEDNVLTLSGVRGGHRDGDTALVRRERRVGSFARAFALPATVERDAIDATYRDGILTVTLPWTEESRPRRIEVKAS